MLFIGPCILMSGEQTGFNVSAGIAFFVSGILLLTRMWKVGPPFFWLGMGFFSINRGLDEKHLVLLLIGSLLVFGTSELLIVAGFKALGQRKQRRI